MIYFQQCDPCLGYLQVMIIQVGQHEGDMPIEKMDINGSGEIVASIGQKTRFISRLKGTLSANMADLSLDLKGL